MGMKVSKARSGALESFGGVSVAVDTSWDGRGHDIVAFGEVLTLSSGGPSSLAEYEGNDLHIVSRDGADRVRAAIKAARAATTAARRAAIEACGEEL